MKTKFIIVKDITRKSSEVRTFTDRRQALDCFNEWNDQKGVYPKAYIKKLFRKVKLNWDELYVK